MVNSRFTNAHPVDLTGMDGPGVFGLFANRFQMEREAGLGGMGVVYRAIDCHSGRAVALKVLRKTDPTAIRRFEREAEALGTLEHPGIVRYFAHGHSEEGEPYLAMEWIEGESLSARIARAVVSKKPLGVREVVALGHALADALAAAHARGIVHRDVKPSNILLVEGRLEEPKLADFGIVRADSSGSMTTSDVVVGTVGYMAPEQARGADDLDGRADLFSLGCVLYRCLTNAEVFEGNGAVVVLAKLLLHDAPRVSDHRADVPSALDDLIACLLAKEPAERPADAVAVKEELARIAASLDGRAHVDGLAVTWRRHKVRRRFRLRPSAWLGIAVTVLTAGVLSQGMRMRQVAVASEAPSPPMPAGTPVIALPVSPSCAPAAADLYRRGLQAMRQTDWPQANHLLEEASNADPSCPQVYVQRVIVSEGALSRKQQRELLAQAAGFRDALSERDRLLLEVGAAIVGPDAAREKEAYALLDQAARRFPYDAQVLMLASLRAPSIGAGRAELELALERSGAAIAIDPGYADAVQSRARILARLGRFDEELAALDQCLEIAPGAVGCMGTRLAALKRRGQCADAVEQARNWTSWAPDDTSAYRQLAMTLASMRSPRETVLEALRLRWERLPAERRASWEPIERARLAVWQGEFAEGARLADELERRLASSPSSESHMRAAMLGVSIAQEIGDDARAGRLAERAMNKMASWVGSEANNGATFRQEPLLFAAALRGNRLSAQQWRQAGNAWEERTQARLDPFERWLLRWAPAVGSGMDAREAMDGMPATDVQSSVRSTFENLGVLESNEGWLRLEAGDGAAAAPLLESAARTCQSLDYPFVNMRSHLWLGRAKEKLGDVPGACAAYRVVIDQWGASKPPSVTAREAKQRSTSLGCGR
ncbi:serine/threonine-protein kinase [Pendulispora brunnea]|uniref:Serine/threonine-protein kinase n=1 Tax=Pendulispora brunnea TaxID=2905690 RepID=A0ABZ2JWB9_9BACT